MFHTSLVPGDFIYSTQLGYKFDDAYFVLLKGDDCTNGENLVVRVLDANVPGKVIKSNEIIIANPKIASKRVHRHPVYQYFNEMNTIVVINVDVDGFDCERIGYVIGTNLDGKVNVRYVIIQFNSLLSSIL